MNAVTRILSRILGKIPTRGTLLTPSGTETYPIAICNEIMGGPFIVDNLDELKEIPQERLLKGCKCTVNEHVTEGITQPTTTYILRVVPTNTLSLVPDVNISEYWAIDAPVQQEESAVQYQYSPDYLNSKPPFLSSVISLEAYNAGYATNEDFASGDTGKKIWKDEYSAQTDVWLRQKSSSIADWGIPMKIDESYSEGTYSDVRFQWVEKILGKPARPQSMIGGVVNNEPAGWLDVPSIPEGEVYEIYIQTHDLWRTAATKNVYKQLSSEWSDPILISTEATLVRYGLDASNTDYFNETYWRPFYSIGDRYKASRVDTDSPWSVELITGESGEYTDFVFKQFPNGSDLTIADAPKTKLGYGTDGWKDGVFVSDSGYTLFVSTSRKYSNGEIISDWTAPVRYDGMNTIQCVITSEDNSGKSFKYSRVSGADVITPNIIKLKAYLYEANIEVDTSNYNVKWFIGTPETGTEILNLNPEVGGIPYMSGIGNCELNIKPNHVTGNQVFSAVAYMQGEDYPDDVTIYDVTDGVGYVPIVNSDKGFIFKGTDPHIFEGFLYENGVDISTANGVIYNWTLQGEEVSTSKTVTIAPEQVSGSAILKLVISFLGVNYEISENLVDVVDGKSIERQYSAQETLIDFGATPDTIGNPNQWSTNATNAVWVIERYTGEAWGSPYRVKGEKGFPNGAFQKTVYKTYDPLNLPSAEWRYTQPTPKTGSGNILIPDGWTETPQTDAPTGSTIYGSKVTFMKNPYTDSIEETTDNWNIQDSWSFPFKVTYFATDGVGTTGPQGQKGWTPVLSIASVGENRYHKIIDFTGGEGLKPSSDIGKYVGVSGLVTNPSDAINIRGTQGIQGNDGVFNASDFWDGATVTISGSTTLYSYVFKFRKAKNGMVYYTGYVDAKTTAVETNILITLTSDFISKCLPYAAGVYTIMAILTGTHTVGQEYYLVSNANFPLTVPAIGSNSIFSDAVILRTGDAVNNYKIRVRVYPDVNSNFNGCYPGSGVF